MKTQALAFVISNGGTWSEQPGLFASLALTITQKRRGAPSLILSDTAYPGILVVESIPEGQKRLRKQIREGVLGIDGLEVVDVGEVNARTTPYLFQTAQKRLGSRRYAVKRVEKAPPPAANPEPAATDTGTSSPVIATVVGTTSSETVPADPEPVTAGQSTR